MNNLTKKFGGLVAVKNINVVVKKDSITAVIGPNGGGKTTFFNVITGIYKPDQGTMLLDGKSYSGLRTNRIAALGVSRTFQNIRLFKNLTVLDNVMIGMHPHLSANLFGILFSFPYVKKEEKLAQIKAFQLLEYVGLSSLLNETAQNLSYGAQRRLEIARALASKPDLLLLDEPAAGMNPKETRDLTDLIRKVRDELNITILLIEHDMKLVMNLSEHIIVLDHGEKIAEGTAEEIRTNAKVIEAYLGKERHHFVEEGEK
ncbi:ABC transporter ATP-binding protein [Bacillus taeanensis]|uniref:ABC transporter ATP-binding protein n=1 Tax=Bacillus taeanensis TaxID=273032 RepID=UPI001FEA63B1|nr:ABC transporter ATP-binding protein [Bacillus taeanensis]